MAFNIRKLIYEELIRLGFERWSHGFYRECDYVVIIVSIRNRGSGKYVSVYCGAVLKELDSKNLAYAKNWHLLSSMETIFGNEESARETRRALGYFTAMHKEEREQYLSKALKEMERVFRQDWQDREWVLAWAKDLPDFREFPSVKLRRYAESIASKNLPD